MAEKFSIDDIISEYSEKVENDLKADESEDTDEVAEEDNSSQQEAEQDNEINDSDHDDYDPIKAVDFDDELAADQAEEKKRNEENAALINNLTKHKKGKAAKQSVPPVNRASLKDIKMGLTGKIIPKTEEFDKALIPDDATYEEKSSILSQHRKKKVENFVLKTDEQDNGPTSEESEDKSRTGQTEFKKFDDAEKVLGSIIQVKSNLVLRLCVLLFSGIFSTFITVANDLELPLIKTFDRTITPAAYLFTNTVLGLISIAVCYNVMLAGMKSLFKRKADNDTIAALGIFVTVIAGIINLFDPESIRDSVYHVYISAAIVGLIFNTLGKLMIVKRTERNFRYVAGDFERYAVTSVDDEETAENFTRGSVAEPKIAAIRKTEFVDNFMKNSYTADISDEYSKKVSPYILIAGIVIALLSLIFDKGAANMKERLFIALAAFSGTVTMCSSFAVMLIVNVPLARATKKYLQYSAVMLGYSSVDEFADTNSLLVDAEQLFPNGSIELANLKLLSAISIEDCILMAASLSCQSGSVLRSTFYKMLRGKTELLYPVESYIYEDGLGLSGWIENKRVLLGTRELMENHSIDGLPSEAKEKEYTKGNVAVYLSISGITAAMFVIEVSPNLSVTRWLQELELEGITTVIRTVDGFLSQRFLSDLFDIERDSVKLLSFRYHKDYESETEYVPRQASSMLCSGHFPSFAMLVIGAKRLKFTAKLGASVMYGATILAGLIALIMMLAGSFVQLTPTLVLVYNLVVTGAALLVQHIKRL
ncbi:hypothetical protein [uncultured Ruminococcus sp.]|uniref:hypothetical protein n=1 Tax=uncultured Ruminococcus sp. TaxID=165186 RepID=UPI002665FD5D|nr:hypothetical protein [uncultured Ruminococcus sp.]